MSCLFSIFLTHTKIVFIKLIRFLLISSCIALFASCEKAPIISHESIDFEFADSIAGIYEGTYTLNTGPPSFSDLESSLTIVVPDKRTEKECKFHVDYFGEDVYLQRDFRIYTTWNYSTQPDVYLSAGFYGTKLRIAETLYTKVYSYTTFEFTGIRQ
ncbi:MAG: hypothetical protein ACI8ZM_001346 [Crocinitomix sp.]|jgi:hypothetical protein